MGAALGSRTPDLRITRTPVTAYTVLIPRISARQTFTVLNESAGRTPFRSTNGSTFDLASRTQPCRATRKTKTSPNSPRTLNLRIRRALSECSRALTGAGKRSRVAEVVMAWLSTPPASRGRPRLRGPRPGGRGRGDGGRFRTAGGAGRRHLATAGGPSRSDTGRHRGTRRPAVGRAPGAGRTVR